MCILRIYLDNGLGGITSERGLMSHEFIHCISKITGCVAFNRQTSLINIQLNMIIQENLNSIKKPTIDFLVGAHFGQFNLNHYCLICTLACKVLVCFVVKLFSARNSGMILS